MESKEARAIEVTYSFTKAAPKPAAPPVKPLESSGPASQVNLPVSQEAKPAAHMEPIPPAEEPKKPDPAPVKPEISVSSQSASSLPEEEFAVVRHKQSIRRHLKKSLSYPAASTQGSVRIALTLDPQGTLKDFAVLEATDMNLATVTIEEAQRAQPYPPFPQGIKSSQVRYEFVVQYRPNSDP